jgi:hypothetical protein
MRKAVEVMREIADRPASREMIGKDVISGRIQPAIGGWPMAGNFPISPTESLHFLDMAVARPGGISFAISEPGIHASKQDRLRSHDIAESALPVRRRQEIQVLSRATITQA